MGKNHFEKLQRIKTLAANAPFLDALTELLPVCLFAKDLHGRYLYVNKSFAAKTLLGDKDAIIGKMPSEVLEHDHATIAEEEDQHILKTGEAIIHRENQNCGLLKDKNYEIISKICVRDNAGNKLGIAGITLDITERKLNENKLLKLNEQLDAQNKRYEEELSLGRQLQKTFVKVKVVEGEHLLDIGYHYQPSAKLSGDLIIAEQLDEVSWTILICDVMGHGIRSALVTGILRSFYDEHKNLLREPAIFVTRLNRHYNKLLLGLDTTLFTTLTCGTLNLNSGEMRLTCAGHHAPIWFRPSTGEFVPEADKIVTQSPAIGLIDDFDYTSRVHTLEDGDAILFYTDGLAESCSPEGEEFGITAIRTLIRTYSTESKCQHLVNTIVAQVHEFADEIDDDISILMLKKQSERSKYPSKKASSRISDSS